MWSNWKRNRYDDFEHVCEPKGNEFSFCLPTCRRRSTELLGLCTHPDSYRRTGHRAWSTAYEAQATALSLRWRDSSEFPLLPCCFWWQSQTRHKAYKRERFEHNEITQHMTHGNLSSKLTFCCNTTWAGAVVCILTNCFHNRSTSATQSANFQVQSEDCLVHAWQSSPAVDCRHWSERWDLESWERRCFWQNHRQLDELSQTTFQSARWSEQLRVS